MTVQLSRLDNGMTIVTDTMARLESAALGIWIKVGSRCEQADEHGISHLLEHMAFKGTQRRTARMIAEEIEAVGGEVNAGTSLESTSYYARVLKSDVPLAVDILADILTASVFDPSELRREQHVIVQEIGAAYDAPEDRVFDLFQETAFPDQPIGRPILGTEDTVTRFDPDILRRYQSDHYRGPQMVLGAAGAVDHEEIAGLVAGKFNAVDVADAPTPQKAHYCGGTRSEIRDLREVQLTLGFEGCAHASDDFFAMQLLASIMGGGMSSRLFQEVRENRGLCYSIYAMHMAFSDTGIFAVHTATGQEDIDTLMPVMLSELSKASHDIKEEELSRARAQLRAGLLMALESPAARAGQISRQVHLYGRPLTTQELVDRIEAVTLADVHSAAHRTITTSRPTLTVVGPQVELGGVEEIVEQLQASI